MVLASYVESSRRCKDERAGLPQPKALHCCVLGVCLCCVFGAALFFSLQVAMGGGRERRVRERGIETRGGRERGGRVAFPFLGPCFLCVFLGSGGCSLSVLGWCEEEEGRERVWVGSCWVGLIDKRVGLILGGPDMSVGLGD